MEDVLTKQEKIFVEIKAETGNGTKAAKKAFKIKDSNYAGVKAHRLIRKDKIVNAIEEALPDELLAKVHREGLSASKEVWKNNNESGEIEKVSEEPDYAVRHKYLDTAYKLKGSYAPEKSVSLNIEVPVGKQKTATDAIVRFLNGNS